MSRGETVPADQVDKIKRLLRETDVSIPFIAERFSLTRSCIVGLNDKFKIRHYIGKNSWRVDGRLVEAA